MDFHSLCRLTRIWKAHTEQMCCLGALPLCSGVKLAHHGRQAAYTQKEEHRTTAPTETDFTLHHFQAVIQGRIILDPLLISANASPEDSYPHHISFPIRSAFYGGALGERFQTTHLFKHPAHYSWVLITNAKLLRSYHA